MKNYSLHQDEVLKSRISISELFKKGKRAKSYPVQVIWMKLPEDSQESKVMFSVPKRYFKLAVDRNRIKRQLREIYRLEKPRLQTEIDGNYHMALLYLSKNKLEYDEIKTHVNRSFLKILNNNL